MSSFVKSVGFGGIQEARVFDVIGWVVRGPKVGPIEGVDHLTSVGATFGHGGPRGMERSTWARPMHITSGPFDHSNSLIHVSQVQWFYSVSRNAFCIFWHFCPMV